jgi:hypothetical protein
LENLAEAFAVRHLDDHKRYREFSNLHHQNLLQLLCSNLLLSKSVIVFDAHVGLALANLEHLWGQV